MVCLKTDYESGDLMPNCDVCFGRFVTSEPPDVNIQSSVGMFPFHGILHCFQYTCSASDCNSMLRIASHGESLCSVCFHRHVFNIHTVKLRVEAGSCINAGYAGVNVICTDRSRVSATSRVPDI